jgi:hypothetical protein
MSVLNQRPIEIEHEGRTIFGKYSTWAGLITVTTERGTKTAEIGATPPKALARIMLRQLAQDGKA